jgi:hypothetical protein
MYFNTLIHIYKQIFMFEKTSTAIERSAKGDTLVFLPHTPSPTLTITFLFYHGEEMVLS